MRNSEYVFYKCALGLVYITLEEVILFLKVLFEKITYRVTAMTAAASIQTDLKVTPLTDLPKCRTYRARRQARRKVSLTKTGRLS